MRGNNNSGINSTNDDGTCLMGGTWAQALKTTSTMGGDELMSVTSFNKELSRVSAYVKHTFTVLEGNS